MPRFDSCIRINIKNEHLRDVVELILRLIPTKKKEEGSEGVPI